MMTTSKATPETATFSGTAGEVPDIPDTLEPAAKVRTLAAPTAAQVTIVRKDLAKAPKDDRPMITLKDPPIEADTIEEALKLANARGRAVFTKGGWVCPSISHDRR